MWTKNIISSTLKGGDNFWSVKLTYEGFVKFDDACTDTDTKYS